MPLVMSCFSESSAEGFTVKMPSGMTGVSYQSFKRRPKW